MSENEISGFIMLGFSLSMVFYFFGQIPRVFAEVIDIFTGR